MRKNIQGTYLGDSEDLDYKILGVDDEIGILDSLAVYMKRTGYKFEYVTNPMEAIELLKKEHFDLLVLDFVMMPIHGDKVVEEVRKFDSEIYILLLTGHKDLAPPLETIKQLDIQGYCEKSDKFDQLLLLIESGIKSISQMRRIKEISEELKESNEKLEQAYIETIQTLRETVDAKDHYTRGHSDRVTEYSMLIANRLNLSEDELKTLHTGALFHDIGKIGVPDQILLKPGKLDDREYSEIKQHPLVGAHILATASIFSDIIPIVKHHHERYDGKGYPSQLKGEDIPYLARIVAVADTYDAMTSNRPYRDALTKEFVIEDIRKNLGTQFDPEIGKVFISILETEYDSLLKIQEKYQRAVQ